MGEGIAKRSACNLKDSSMGKTEKEMLIRPFEKMRRNEEWLVPSIMIYRIYETLKKRKETAAQQKKLLVLKRKYYFLREIFFYFSFRNFAYYQEKYSAIFLFIASALFRF